MTNNHQKNGSILQQSPATEEFIRTSVRTYPICKAYMTSIEDFKQTGEASIFVIRKHDNKYTSAMYFWTEYGKGFNNTIHFIDIDEKAQQALEKQFVEDEKAAETDYALVHNFIYQAIQAEKEYDSESAKQCNSFQIDQFILAPENEIEKIDLGIDFIEVAKDTCSEWPLKDWYTPNERRMLPNDDAPYSYQKPEYKHTTNYHHPDIIEELYSVKYNDGLPSEFIDRVLALPHEELREDFENLLYSAMALGTDTDNWPKEKRTDAFINQVRAAIQFLGAIGDKRSLTVLLEFQKQENAFCNFFLAGNALYITGSAIAYCFHEQYSLVEDFLKEKGTEPLWKMNIAEIACKQFPQVSGNTENLKKMFGSLLQFYLDIGESWEYYNRNLAGFVCVACTYLKAREYLPLIKELFDRKLAEKMIGGDYDELSLKMDSDKGHAEPLTDIYNYRLFK